MKNTSVLPNISIHASHNASFAVELNGEILEVLELERFFNFKNLGYKHWDAPNAQPYVAKLVLNYFKDKYGFEKYNNCLHQHAEDYLHDIPAETFVECKHHESHAYGTFYQSPFNEALVVSFDGGGNDGYFKIFKANRKNGLTLLKEYPLNLGCSYMAFGHFLGDIKFDFSHAALVYAGKILGLQSYGTPRQEWIPHFREYYFGNNWEQVIGRLSYKVGVRFDTGHRLTGQLAYDIAATSQQVFEDITFECIDEIVQQNQNLPICITGGCALNIVFNTKAKQRYNREIFVGPNPSDCGLTIGMLAGLIKPDMPFDATYLGPEMLDKYLLPEYIEKTKADTKTSEELAYELSKGKIVGLIQGRAEHGPRVLGNRSIICNPLITDMKDRLNFKVKHREWYRPFAPVVRLEDVNEYFDWEGESRWMSFCVNVKEKYRKLMPAIVHIDNTARVQTITREQNPLLYELLTEFKKVTGVGVLLNTSFNVDGKPILSTYTDAFRALNETELDAVYAEGFYFTK